MSFSPAWDEFYSNNRFPRHGTTGNLVMLFQNFITEMTGQRVLELGCGVGNNRLFIEESGAIYCGVDGAQAAIDKCGAGNYACCDFTEGQPFGDDFDIVFDRAAIAHNDSPAVTRAIDIAWHALKPGGIFIGSDWFSTNHSEFVRGDVVDLLTRTGYPDGQFFGVGNVHFTNERELSGVFSAFQCLFVTERIERCIMASELFPRLHRHRWQSTAFNGTEYRSAVWDLVFRKPL